MEAHNSADQLTEQLKLSEQAHNKAQAESNELDGILLKIMRHAKFKPKADTSVRMAAPEISFEAKTTDSAHTSSVINH
jgi:hypothetical protein